MQKAKFRLVLASGNAHKLQEIRDIVGDRVDLEGFNPVEVVMPEETGETFTDNARLKAVSVAEQTGQPALADDSGICIDALGGAPGVQSNRFLGEDSSAEERNEAVLSLLAATPEAERTARFVCAACIAWPGGQTLDALATCEGVIARSPSGGGGFGYDPIFFIPRLGCTLAEVSSRTKNAISHRGKAVTEVIRQLLEADVLPPEG